MSKLMSEICSLRAKRLLGASPHGLSMLVGSVDSGQVKVFRTAGGEPIGYLAWMSLTPESMRYVMDFRVYPPYSYEWSEGRLMMIFDVVISPGWNRVAIDQIAKFLSRSKFVSYFKYDRLNFVDKSLLKRYVAHKAMY